MRHERSSTPPVRIDPFTATDLPGLAAVLARVRDLPVPYPPAEAGTGEAELAAWLAAEPALARWVARLGGQVVGHVQVGPAHAYLTAHAGPGVGLEVGRLFVDPLAHRRGVGAALLGAALGWARDRDRVAALAVIDGSDPALALYRSVGLDPAGCFVGVHGLNHVFVDRGR